MLPYDMFRCAPESPDENCKHCLRYVHLPNQTFGMRTPVSSAIESSSDVNCKFIPLHEKQQKV